MPKCMSADCGQSFKEAIGIGSLNGGLGVTPCCRSMWWCDDQGKLVGPPFLDLFCEKCNSLVGLIESEFFFKRGRPKVWHDDCETKKNVTQTARDLRSVAAWIEYTRSVLGAMSIKLGEPGPAAVEAAKFADAMVEEAKRRGIFS